MRFPLFFQRHKSQTCQYRLSARQKHGGTAGMSAYFLEKSQKWCFGLPRGNLFASNFDESSGISSPSPLRCLLFIAEIDTASSCRLGYALVSRLREELRRFRTPCTSEDHSWNEYPPSQVRLICSTSLT